MTVYEAYDAGWGWAGGRGHNTPQKNPHRGGKGYAAGGKGEWGGVPLGRGIRIGGRGKK